MAATNRKMGVRFRFKTETTQRVYPLLEIMLKLIFIEITKFKSQTGEIFQTYWIKYFVSGIEDRLRINFLNFKYDLTFLISGLSLFHSSIT